MDPQSEEVRRAGQPQEAKHQLPTVYEWVGTVVVLNYAQGPHWPLPEDPYALARGAIEGREGVFFLSEVSRFGILVRRLEKRGKLGESVFIPWGAIHAISELSPAEESETEQE